MPSDGMRRLAQNGTIPSFIYRYETKHAQQVKSQRKLSDRLPSPTRPRRRLHAVVDQRMVLKA